LLIYDISSTSKIRFSKSGGTLEQAPLYAV
jgi:hypothetical protein